MDGGSDDPTLNLLVELALVEVTTKTSVLGTTVLETPVLWRRYIVQWVRDVIAESETLARLAGL